MKAILASLVFVLGSSVAMAHETGGAAPAEPAHAQADVTAPVKKMTKKDAKKACAEEAVAAGKTAPKGKEMKECIKAKTM